MSDEAQAAGDRRRMQRLRVGITGLAAVILLLVLAFAVANSLNRSVASDNQSNAVATQGDAPDNATEPLAELGMAPPRDSANGTAPPAR